VLNDIGHTGLLLAKRERNRLDPDKEYFAEVQRGLLQFKAYQTSAPFRIEDAIITNSHFIIA
jgi:hypothetical protein